MNSVGVGGRLPIAGLIAIFGLALLARAWQPGHLGLGHYDEGVYAISAGAVATWPEGDLFPGQTRFSPPVWFATVGVIARVADLPPHVVALGLNVLVGSLIALGVAIVACRWFGAAAGMAAGLIAAFDPLGIMLSRSGLTDPTFALMFLFACAAMVELLARPGWRPVVLAGIAAGLAWNTKYHGWFVFVIAASAIVARWWRRPAGEPPIRVPQLARRVAASAVIAALIYLPWALYMRGASGGRGLRGIVTYYASLIGAGWIEAAGRHLSMQAYLDGPLAHLAVPLALVAALWLEPARVNWRRYGILLAVVVVATLLAGALAAVALLALAGAVAAWRERFTWPTAVLLAWLGLWLVAAPFYHPYARLLLPMLVALALLAGMGVIRAMDWARAERREQVVAAPMLVAAAVAIALAVLPIGHRGAAEPWHDDRGTARAAARLNVMVPVGAELRVVGEPALVYHLGLLGRDVPTMLTGIESVDTVSGELWIAAGVYARRAPTLRDAIDALGGRRDSLAALALDPGDLRVLDDFSVAEARAWRQQPDGEFDVIVYRVAPRAPLMPVIQASAP